ncbi:MULTISPECIES: hypothetical protein [Chitinophagaceae]
MPRFQKSIILGLTQSFDFSDVMESELRKLNFEVINISYPDHVFKYKNPFQRLQNLIRKLFWNDRHFKNKLKFKPFEKTIKGKLENIVVADYALIIRPDIYPETILETIKAKSKVMVGYQWDGLERFKIVNDYIALFDRFFVFDATEENRRDNILPLTNFYFENTEVDARSQKTTAFFCGSYFKSRVNVIEMCAEKLTAYGVYVNFYLHVNGGTIAVANYPHVHFISEAITYNEYLEFLKGATIIADFLNPVHKGLSFRVFEAIGYKKKLITTNSSVRHYDFYHPDNIFILENNNWSGLAQFLFTDYQPIPEEIREKYCFKNWINYVLDMGGQ